MVMISGIYKITVKIWAIAAFLKLLADHTPLTLKQSMAITLWLIPASTKKANSSCSVTIETTLMTEMMRRHCAHLSWRGRRVLNTENDRKSGGIAIMRELSIAYGNSCYAKTWSNKTTSWDELCNKLSTTIRTTESAEEYPNM